MKSALEIAMERTKAIGDQAREELAKLSPAARKKIAEVKKVYEGKIAEREVLFQQEMMKLTGGAPVEAIQAQLPDEAREALGQMRQKHKSVIDTLETEREGKIQAIKKEAV
ncbi:MAG: hypothetical protein O2807_09525 [bacterium]|nr:hypothetical protein [bacterium]